MPTYHTTLNRTFSVLIDAETEEDAARLSEFFIGSNDVSSQADRQRFQFKFEKIDVIENDVIDVIEIESPSS